MHIKDIFIKHDRRRGQWRMQPLGWVTAALALLLAASLSFCACQGATGPQLRATPTARQMDAPTPAVADSGTATAPPTPRPAATAIVHETCPSEPALWRLLSYHLPGAEGTTLYAVDPPCVMARAEQTFRDYLAYREAHGRQWTVADQERFFSPDGFTAPLSGDAVGAVTGTPAILCDESVGDESVGADGEPAGFDTYVAFYTIARQDDGRVVADLLFVSRPRGPFTTRQYDCATGELLSETPNDGTQTFVLYQPLLYEDGRWRLGHRYDTYDYIPAAQSDPQALIGTVLRAQGRGTD